MIPIYVTYKLNTENEVWVFMWEYYIEYVNQIQHKPLPGVKTNITKLHTREA
jgi:hypothetical protein